MAKAVAKERSNYDWVSMISVNRDKGLKTREWATDTVDRTKDKPGGSK